MPLRSRAQVWWLDVQGEQQVDSPGASYLVALSGEVRAGAQALAVGDGVMLGDGSLTLSGQGAVLWLKV
jgi:hypothetical protein